MENRTKTLFSRPNRFLNPWNKLDAQDAATDRQAFHDEIQEEAGEYGN